MRPLKTNTFKNPQERQKAAQWERNMSILYTAIKLNEMDPENRCGYYVDNKYKNGKRVISLFEGLMTFRVPDSFDLGNLPEVTENWDGHTTEEKYTEMMRQCGCKFE